MVSSRGQRYEAHGRVVHGEKGGNLDAATPFLTLSLAPGRCTAMAASSHALSVWAAAAIAAAAAAEVVQVGSASIEHRGSSRVSAPLHLCFSLREGSIAFWGRAPLVLS